MNKTMNKLVLIGTSVAILASCDSQTQNRWNPFGEYFISKVADMDPFYKEPKVITEKESHKQSLEDLQASYKDLNNSDKAAVEKDLTYYIGDSLTQPKDEPITCEEFMEKYAQYHLDKKTKLTVIPQSEWTKEAIKKYNADGKNSNVFIYSQYTEKSKDPLNRFVIMSRGEDDRFYIREMVSLQNEDKDPRLTTNAFTKYKAIK